MVLVKKSLIPEIRTVTKDGECNVNIQLELVITINQDGVKAEVATAKKEPEDDRWAIPDFTGIEKINFGK